VVTYNGRVWIQKCLDSLMVSEYPVHVIVVDNGSGDGTASFVKNNYPLVEIIESGKNLGFGQGNNLGFERAIHQQSDYIFLLNQDAWVEKDTIDRLVDAHSKNPDFGILSPLHLNGKGNDFEEEFLQYLLKSDIKKLLWENLIHDKNEKQIIPSPFVNAAAWLISSDCLIKTGAFDPIFFHYGEDDHYAQRVYYNGFKIGILPSSRIFHDKETKPIDAAENLNRGINRDWIFFLTHACNINRPGFKWFMLKRGCRHLIQFAGSLFSPDKYKRIYNLTMAKKIFSNFSKVKKSRATCANGVSPFLRITGY
jgi:GT2 family glycosyltransferase